MFIIGTIGTAILISPAMRIIRNTSVHVGEDSGGFEYFRLGFAQGCVPTEFDSVPDTARRALSNGPIGDPNPPTYPPKIAPDWFLPMGHRTLPKYFRLGFAQGCVPTEFDSVPGTARRALCNGTLGDPNISTLSPEIPKYWVFRIFSRVFPPRIRPGTCSN